MGYDPDYLMVKQEQAPAAPEAAPMEQPMGPGPEMTLDDLLAAQQNSVPAPAEAVQESFGGPGVPGATDGGLAL